MQGDNDFESLGNNLMEVGKVGVGGDAGDESELSKDDFSLISSVRFNLKAG